MNVGGPEMFGIFFFGLLWGLIPLAITVYVVLLLRRMTQALERIDRRFAERPSGDDPAPR